MAPPETTEPMITPPKPQSLNKMKRHLAGGQRPQPNLQHMAQAAGKPPTEGKISSKSNIGCNSHLIR